MAPILTYVLNNPIAPMAPNPQTDAGSNRSPSARRRREQRALDSEAFRLHVEEHQTFATIALTMKCHQDTAAQRVARAEARLARRLVKRVAEIKAGQHTRYLSLLRRTLPAGDAPITPKEAEATLHVLDRIDRLWGLDRSPPSETPNTLVLSQHTTIAPHQLASQARALLGKDVTPVEPLSASDPLQPAS